MSVEDAGCFVPKNSQGVMARYCMQCNEHIDLHGHKRLIRGMARSCRPEALTKAASTARSVGSENVQSTPEQVSVQREAVAYTPAVSTAPFGTDFTSSQSVMSVDRCDDANFVRIRKAGLAAPQNHLGGSSCEVVHDPDADDFLPIHISGRGGCIPPKGNLSGAAVHSQFNELQAVVQPNSNGLRFASGHVAQQNHLYGGSLVPK